MRPTTDRPSTPPPPPGPQGPAEVRVRQMDGPLWVFAYGSLMWRPGFRFQDTQPALLHGWRRTLCIKSIHYRGTPDCPGLVMGLDRGGSCRGWAYQVSAADRLATVDYLDARELPTRTYHARFLPLRLEDGRKVVAYGYVADTAHPQYAGSLAVAAQADMVVAAQGREGPCREYLANTVQHLDRMGLPAGPLHRVLQAVDAALGLAPAGDEGSH